MNIKQAQADHEILDILAKRWSPRAFAPKPVPESALLSMLEAARWAPSCYNEQPWYFVVATQADPEAYKPLFDCLLPGNQAWAHSAPVLMLSIARSVFRHNAKPNRHAMHDVGQAVAQMTVQAVSQGLLVHQMAGFSPKKSRESFSIPDDCEPAAAIAVGYPGDPQMLNDNFREMEIAPRERTPLSEFVFHGKFGVAGDLVK